MLVERHLVQVYGLMSTKRVRSSQSGGHDWVPGWEAAPGRTDPDATGIYPSKLIWIVQLMILYRSAQRERQGDGRTLTSIQACYERYLYQANDTPMGKILRWHACCCSMSRRIASTTMRHLETKPRALSRTATSSCGWTRSRRFLIQSTVTVDGSSTMT